MTTPLSTFARDRSPRWILAPGVASTRQIEIRNDTDEAVEAHLRVDQPATASVSPAVLTIPARHSRLADIIFLAGWSAADRTLALSFQDAQGNDLGFFSQELVAADSTDCAISLELKDDVMAENELVALKLWCTVVSRSSTPRRFEIDYNPHPALRFPERKTVTLGPGESAAFEVPVQWNRAVRDVSGWNHPRAIEAFVPVSDGRRGAFLPWERIEQRLDPYLNADDRQAKSVTAPPERRTAFMQKTPGQLKYEELIELKRLEQGVVAPATQRPAAKPAEAPLAAPAPAARRSPVAALVTIAFALVALVLAGLFFIRPPERQASTGPVRVAPFKLSPAPVLKSAAVKTQPKPLSPSSTATPVWSSVRQASRTPNTVTAPQRTPAAAATQATAVAAKRATGPAQPADRNAVVTLSGVEAAYAPGGHAVSVAWNGSAQASAFVELMDFTGKVIASRMIHGSGAQTMFKLPRGYRGPVSVSVTAFGYHGERVVQSASLGSAE